MFIAIFILVIGFAGVVATRGMLRVRSTVSRWPKTQGRIVEREVTRPSTFVGGAGFYRWQPRLKYTYRVGEETFTSERVQYPQAPINSKARSQLFLDAVPALVTVLYDPARPADSWLFLPVGWHIALLVVASLGVSLVGLLILFVEIMKRV